MEIEKYAQKYIHFYDEDIEDDVLIKYLICTKWSSLLDCGCGDGSLLYALQKNNFLKDKKVYAIDLSKNRVARVIKNIKNVSAYVDNAEKMATIADQSIDFFISTKVIEHVNDKEMIKAVKRVTKTGSIIYISTLFKKKWGWYFHRNNGMWVIDPTHLREYTSDEQLLNLFSKDEFEVLENIKKPILFSLIDFFIRKLGVKDNKIYFSFLKYLKFFKIPVPGYYSWTVVLRRKKI